MGNISTTKAPPPKAYSYTMVMWIVGAIAHPPPTTIYALRLNDVIHKQDLGTIKSPMYEKGAHVVLGTCNASVNRFFMIRLMANLRHVFCNIYHRLYFDRLCMYILHNIT